jgi:hypothetical protein
MALDNDTPSQDQAPAAAAAGAPSRQSSLQSALLFVPIAVLIFATSWVPVDGSDLWAHAAVGRWIVRHGHVPTHTLFLWTAHNPWIAHSWLSEILIYYLIQGRSDEHGAAAALIAVAIAATIAFLIIFLRWRRLGVLGIPTLLIFCVAVVGSASRFQARAEMLSAILYTLTLLLADRMQSPQDRRDDEKARRTALLCVPLLVISWVNLHGMFPVGLMVLGLAAACSFIDHRFSTSTRILAASVVVSLLCSGINPYGYRLWTALLSIKSHTFAYIIEWQPVWVLPLTDTSSLICTGALIAMCAAVLLANPRRRLFDVLLFLVQLVLLLKARRFIFFMCLTCLWVIGNNINAAWQTRSAWAKRVAGALPSLRALITRLPQSGWEIALAVILLVPIYAFWWPSGHGRWLLKATARSLAVEQANWILSHHIKENCLNDYDDSSYLEWRFGNGPLLATDTLDAYPDSVQEAVADIWELKPQGEAMFSHINVVLGRRPKSFDTSFPRLDYYLHDNKHWIEIFPGPDSDPIWLRLPPGKTRTWSNPKWISNSIPNAPGLAPPDGR